MSTVQYRSKESYHSLTSREMPVESRYAIPVAQDAILVGRNGLMAKILQRLQESMVKLYCD